MTTPINDSSTDNTRRLTALYVLALSLVAALSIGGQVLVQWSLARQLGDSTVVNIAGRQRMLSQRIAKHALAIQSAADEPARNSAQQELSADLSLWKECHLGLQAGNSSLGLPGKNSPAVAVMFAELAPSFAAMQAAGESLVSLSANDLSPEAHQAVFALLHHERKFLAGMDRIVHQYDREAHDRVARLQIVERILLGLTLLVLLLEGLLIFRPAVLRIRTATRQLQQTNAELSLAKEAAEAANEEKSRFLANISHELRTPLHAVLISSELAQQETASASVHQRLATIDDAARSLLALLNDVLEMARIEAGKLELNPTPTDIAALARRIAAMFVETAHQKRLTLHCQVGENLPSHMLADESRLRQVLVNLVGNALKFTEGGSVTLQVELLNSDNGKARLRFAVHDTGPGIPREQQARIFDRFTQVDDTARRQHGGAGLGLAISSRIVALMGSTIALQSELQRGSTFSFEVLLPTVSDTPAQGAPPTSLGDFPSLAGLRVLVADDSPINRRLTEDLLRQQGCEVLLAADGPQAIAVIKREQPDLALLDVHMPGLDGPEVAAQILEFDASLGRPPTPLIGLTADAMSPTRAACLQAGMNRVLIKPVESRNLLQAIRELSEPLSPASSHHPTPDALARLGGRADLFVELAELFREHLPSLVSEFKTCFEQGDWPAVQRLAHQCKGQIAVFETGPTLNAAECFETAARSGEASQIAAAWRDLRPLLADFANRLPASSPSQVNGLVSLGR